MTSMFVIRWIMVALTAVLAVALIAHGNVLIGGVIGALTVMRIALLAGMQRRRAQRREHFQQRREQFRQRRAVGGAPRR